jgi:hypothetical protein
LASNCGTLITEQTLQSKFSFKSTGMRRNFYHRHYYSTWSSQAARQTSCFGPTLLYFPMPMIMLKIWRKSIISHFAILRQDLKTLFQQAFNNGSPTIIHKLSEHQRVRRLKDAEFYFGLFLKLLPFNVSEIFKQI